MQVDKYLKMSESFQAERVIEDIASISRFHRIQGSRGLADAADFIMGSLNGLKISAVLYSETYDGLRKFANLRVPIGWEVIYGEVEIEEKMLTTEKSPLVVLAHSPSGECEGEVVVIERKEDWKKARGKIVLIGENWRENYRKANEVGAIGFIIYRRGLKNALPYVGLFLQKKDFVWAKIPAVAISETWALEIIEKRRRDKRVHGRIRVKTEIKEKEVMPVVYATIGKPPYLLFSAHLCHPKPGANDNASGSAMLLELARLLSKIHSDTSRLGFAFLWIPEHIGSGAFVERFANLKDYYGVINLDMVGGESVVLVRPSLSRFSILSGVVEFFLKRTNAQTSEFGNLPIIKSSVHPYRMGSDHDIFNIFGVPALTLITWPDPYYHSSEDSVDKIHKNTVEIIGRAVLSSAVFLSTGNLNELSRFAHSYKMIFLGEIDMQRKVRVAKSLVSHGLWRDSYYLGINNGKKIQKDISIHWLKRGMVTQDIISSNNREIFRIFTRKPGNLVLLHELLMLGEMLPIKDALEALREEYGTIKRNELKKMLRILEMEGIIRLNKKERT